MHKLFRGVYLHHKHPGVTTRRLGDDLGHSFDKALSKTTAWSVFLSPTIFTAGTGHKTFESGCHRRVTRMRGG